MGPLFFNIFINYILLFNSEINIYNYAGDNCISFAGRSIDVITDTLHKESVSDLLQNADVPRIKTML